MSSSSDSDSDIEPSHTARLGRLGDCEVCGGKDAIYTCPKCEVKTCCLECVRIHKKELTCDGTRDRTKFIYMKDFTDTDLLSDYRLLEECARFVYAVKRDEKKRFTRIDKGLPLHLHKLRLAARQRGTVLQFIAQNFTRHKINTTKYMYKTNLIQWRVEWIFPTVENKPLKFVDETCSEKKKLSELLDKFLNPNAPAFEGSKELLYYKSAGFSGVKVLLKAEKLKGSAKKFFELDLSESLAENLSGKCVVEFPIIFVVLKDHAYNFEIITPEDEFDCETNNAKDETVDNIDNKKINLKRCTSNDTTEKRYESTSNGDLSVKKDDVFKSHDTTNKGGYQRKRPKILLTEKIAEEKKMEIQKEIKEAKKKKPKNLLFTTGYSSEENISGSDDENEKKS
ncbi:box C/D snoRNA protein 1 [Bicyclus anynana]|uniref:Box C/D snoRNA protein 1 n=1 Tax=Bicyclus anynana TaxID=110368 RepID=A0A6J1NRE4_BICAN|nr:box C/D snoRNA protein 1 [Bicyclus anynana]